MSRNAIYRASVVANCVALACYMTMSPALLTAIGDPYMMTTGSYVFKLHPGTYVLFAASALTLFSRGNPLASAIVFTRARLAPVLHLCCVLLLFGYSTIRYGPSGSAFLIETFFAPALIVLTLTNLTASDLRFVYRVIIGLLVVNSVIAIGETLTKEHLIPYTISDNVVVNETFFRATALLGHPLNNAIVTGSLLFTTLDMRSLLSKVLLVGLFFIALLVFGGRAAFLMAAVLLSGYLLFKAISGILTFRYTYLEILGGLLFAFFLIALFGALIESSGFGERIFSNLYLDDSATVRIQSWNAFNYMTPGEIIFGVAPQDIFHVMFRLGLNYPFETIENPWIFMAMQFGLFGLLVLVAALGSAIWWFYRRTAVGGHLALLVFFVVATTFSSLGSKTCTLTLLFAALTCLTGYDAQRPHAVARSEFAGGRAGATLEADA
jgi:hypothetical protein